MTTDKPGSPARVRRARSRRAWALVGFSAIAVVFGVAAPPAGALAAPAATAAPPIPSHDGGVLGAPSATAGRAEPGHPNMAMLAVFVGLGLTIGLRIAGRAGTTNERTIRRFRVELRNADVSDLCPEAIGVDRDQTIWREPPSPGATGS